MMFTIPALITVAAANWWLIFYAPKMKMVGHVNFVLVLPPKPKEIEPPTEKKPFWIYLVSYGVATIIVGVAIQIKPVRDFMDHFVEFIAVTGFGIMLFMILFQRCKPVRKAVVNFLLWATDSIMPLLRSSLEVLKPGPK